MPVSENSLAKLLWDFGLVTEGHHLSNCPDMVLFNSYTMAKRDLPDIYAQARGPQAQGRGHIYQANPEWPWYK